MGSQSSKEEGRGSRRRHKAERNRSESADADSFEESFNETSVSESSSKTPISAAAAAASARRGSPTKNYPREQPLQEEEEELVPTSRGDNTSSMISSFVADDEVKVNLAMADLMAYLQVVANNSANLPLTRRDDPEVPKTVSSLTHDEYARKSAAFIPADVRVIAGSFTKYGRVWDLPTSEEFNAVDGAHEPGRSYGGACANAMLKVLYDDAANDKNGGVNPNYDYGDNDDDDDAVNINDSLFDDDEESTVMGGGSTIGGGYSFSRDRTFQSLTLGDVATITSITWATLLRKMKAEIAEIEYAQAPTITSTRKFDLNTPFSLIPQGFDDTKNKKRSLLIGCNYNNIHGAELKASHDDIRSMKDYIINVHGFSEQKGSMTVLLDDDSHKHPSHLNITESFKALSEQSQPGDAVFVHFSGHGGRVLDEESYDEVIVPSDFQTSGLVRDTLLFKTLLAPMRYGVTVTILVDCCDTGMVLDLPYAWTTKTDRMDTLAKLTLNDDFSFVRFLKVVKTLYEASTFTQLGRTVGSALQHGGGGGGGDNAGQHHDNGDYDEQDEGDNDTHDEDTTLDTANQDASLSTSLMIALTACNDTPVAAMVLEQQEAPKPLNFLEKVLSCTLAADEDMSDDDDTYRTDVEPNTTFETEEESYHHRRRRRR